MLKLCCYIPNDQDILVVYIDKTHTVGDLKTKIKKDLPQTLAEIDAHSLALFKINVDTSQRNKRPSILDENTTASISSR